MDVTSYLLGKKAGSGGTINNQNKTITENGSYTADAGYTGLGVVTVDVETPAPNLQNKNVTITENTTTNISADSGYDGLGQVSVTTNVPTGGGSIDWSEIGYSGEPQSIQDGFDYAKDIYDNWDSTQTSMQNKYAYNNTIVYFPLVDTSNVSNMASFVRDSNTFQYFPLVDTSNVSNMTQAFYNCTALQKIIIKDTTNVTAMNSMLDGCSSLIEIGELNAEKVTNCSRVIGSSSKVEIFGGLKNLGQAYLTSTPANWSSYTLDLHYSSKYTHDSLMNVINKLYDIATKGCNVQQLVLGSTNLAKLTAEEIAIATNKGFSVS